MLWLDADKSQPVNLSDVDVKAEIRNRPSGATVIPIDCTVELPNVIAAELTAPNSAMIPGAGAFWDLQLTFPAGDVFTVLAGSVSLTPDITDSRPVALVVVA